MQDNWFFDEQLWQDFYDCMFSSTDFQRAEQQIDALFAYLGYLPERILDLGCGPGRHALPLAQRGCRVTALDSSALLLDKLRSAMAASDVEASQIEILHQDMRTFSRPGHYDLITSLWTSFGYFDDEQDNLELLRQCHSNLNAEGVLLIDTVGKEYLTRNLQPVHARDYDDGRILIERPVLNDNMTRVSIEWLLINGEQVKRTEFSHAIYSGVELADRLHDAGFEDVVLYGDWEAGDYNIDAERLIAVARK